MSALTWRVAFTSRDSSWKCVVICTVKIGVGCAPQDGPETLPCKPDSTDAKSGDLHTQLTLCFKFNGMWLGYVTPR